MRPTIRKSTKAPAPKKAPSSVKNDAARTLVRVRKQATEALAEVRLARSYMAKSYAGPEHDAIAWAESLLEKAVK